MKLFGRLVVITTVALAVFNTTSALAEYQPVKTDQLKESASKSTRTLYPDADDVILLDRTFTDYQADGTYEIWSESAVKILTEKGRRKNRNPSVHYDAAYGKAGFKFAEVLHSDGSRTMIDIEANSRTMIDPGQMKSNIYNPNNKIVRLSIPELGIGDILHYVTTRQLIKPRVPNTFSDYTIYELTSPIVHASYTVNAPQELPLVNIALKDEVGKTMSFSSVTNNGTISYTWKANRVPRIFKEPAMPALHTVVQRLLISTITDWKDLSRWYWNLCEPHLNAVTPGMLEKVQELTAGTESPQKQIENLFYFVSQEIRYMGITIEDEAPGYEPHDVSLTFNNRYGVCRDKAALLVSMLRQAGFKAYPVIIHVGPKKDTEVPQPFFNHAIVAVENGDGTYQLMDPTNENTKDLLPRYLGDKSYLVAKPGGETLLTSPIIPADENLLRIRTSAWVDSSKEVRAESVIHFDGINDTIYRGRLSRIKPEQQREFFETRLKKSLPAAVLEEFDLSPKEVRDTSEPLQLTLRYRVANLFVEGESDVIFTPPLIGSSIGVANFILGKAGLEKREYPLRTEIACGVSEEYTVKLNGSLGALRSNLERQPIDTHALKWNHQLKFKKGTLIGNAGYTLEVVEFSPEEYRELKQNLKQIEYNNHKKLVFSRPALENDPEADSVLLENTVDYDLNDEQNWTVRTHVKKKVLTYSGKKKSAELKFNYNPAWETVELLKATVTTGGEIKEITDKELNLMDAKWVASAPRYPASKVLVANLPGVEAGSIIEYEVLRTIKGKPFFSAREYFAGNDPVIRKTVRITTPKKMAFKKWHSLPSELSKEIKQRKDTRTYIWKAENQPGHKPEANLPPMWTIRPAVIASTGKLDEYAGTVLEALNAATENQAITANKARELTREKKGTDKIRVIRDFVAQNIRRAGPALSDLPLSAITPADQTLQEGYGNSSDRAVLLFSLLKSVGLKPEFVIGTRLPLLRDSAQEMINQPQRDYFNTPLVRVESGRGWIYLDGSSHYAQLEASPWDKRFVLTHKGRIEAVDIASEFKNQQSSLTDIELDAHGSAHITQTTFFYGTAYESFHKKVAELPPEERNRYHQQLVSAVSQSAQADGELITAYEQYPARQQLSVKADRYAVRDGELLYLTVPVNLAGLLPYTIADRNEPVFRNNYQQLSQTCIIKLPKGYEPSILPPLYRWTAPENSGQIQIESIYDEISNQIHIFASADLAPGIIPVDEYPKLLKAHQELAHAKMRTILLKKVK
ncbi:DUF3857 domain-containing protein [Verrucomicrobiota bacterium]